MAAARSKWRDKREVLCITTANHPEMVEVQNRFRQKKRKPKEIAIYNEFMSGIDRTDQMVSYYSSPRKTIRWYKKLMFHFLDIAVWNSFYIYKRKKGINISFVEFRDSLIKSLVQLPNNIKHGSVLVKTGAVARGKKSIINQPSTSTNELDPGISKTHFIEKIPFEHDRKRKTVYLRCKQCSKSKIRKETSFRCKNCTDNVALCPGKCFEDYHT